MNRITVIADDITGAAEIAGIGFHYGLNTAIVTDFHHPLPDVDLLVIATDTRSMKVADASDETRRVVRELKKRGIGRLFKKTDSALRGHIAAELHVLMEETDYKEVMLLPQNPSRGRMVKNGIYYIHETPLHETAFAYDPEFPQHTSLVSKILPEYKISDTETMDEVYRVAEKIGADTLPVGAADLFIACLAYWGYSKVLNDSFCGLSTSKTLIVCGSTQSTSLDSYTYINKYQIPILPLSHQSFYAGTPEDAWLQMVNDTYRQSNGLVLTTNGYLPQEGKEFAVRLRETTARIVKTLVQEELPNELVIEGGATAFCILQTLGWSRFRLTNEINPGVVRMSCLDCSHVHVTLKPGSYPWGRIFDTIKLDE